jgi:hypothetical protein
MRKTPSLLIAIALLAAPMSARAYPPRGGYRIPPQKPRYIKPQKITPENPAVAEARAKRLAKLKADLDAIAPKAKVTPEQQDALVQDLMAVVDGSNKPPAAPVRQLSGDLAAALANRGPGTLDTEKLAGELKVVMNSAYTAPVVVTRTINAGQDLWKASGVAADVAKTITADLKAIASQVQAQGQPGMIK